MAYWLCVTSEENWKVIRERNVPLEVPKFWNLSRKHFRIVIPSGKL